MTIFELREQIEQAAILQPSSSKPVDPVDLLVEEILNKFCNHFSYDEFVNLMRKEISTDNDELFIKKIVKLLQCEGISCYHYALLSILCQFIDEKVAENEKKSHEGEGIDSEQFEEKLSELKETLEDINEEFKILLNLTLTHFFSSLLLLNEEKLIFKATNKSRKQGETSEYSHHDSEEAFVQLLSFLKKRDALRFEHEFKILLSTGLKKYGPYYEVMFKPFAIFFYQLTVSQDLWYLSDQIFLLCPYVGCNSSLKSYFRDLQKMIVIGERTKFSSCQCLFTFLEALTVLRIKKRLEYFGWIYYRDLEQTNNRISTAKVIVENELSILERNKELFGISSIIVIGRRTTYTLPLRRPIKKLLEKIFDMEMKKLKLFCENSLRSILGRPSTFVRNPNNPESLFDNIMKLQGMSLIDINFIKLIWDECNIDETPQLLQMV